MALSRSKIDYLTHVWNPAIGCLRGCNIERDGFDCWARGWAKRQAHNCALCGTFTPHVHSERLYDITPTQEPARIGVGFFGDLFGPWRWQGHPDEDRKWGAARVSLLADLRARMAKCPQHRFIMLTKFPENIPDFNWPDNVWIGTSVTFRTGRVTRCRESKRLCDLQARVRQERRWWSVEPCMDGWYSTGIDWPAWMVFGGQSGKGAQGMAEDTYRWWREVTEAIDEDPAVPLFVKRNARIADGPQEYPEGLMLN